MCGLAGILGDASRPPVLLHAMAASLVYRRPDDDGIWQDAEARVGFALRRLSIVNLSPAGHQPMHSADGRVTLAYLSEIYNHRVLFGPSSTRGARSLGAGIATPNPDRGDCRMGAQEGARTGGWDVRARRLGSPLPHPPAGAGARPAGEKPL